MEERYAKALDEDDIIDFEHDVIIKDKGVLKKNKRVGFGTLADSVRSVAGEEEEPSATDYEDDEDDADELDTFASVPESSVREGLLQFRNIPRRRLPPIGEADPADKDDLQSFLEANSRMQFDEDDDEVVLDVLVAEAAAVLADRQPDVVAARRVPRALVLRPERLDRRPALDADRHDDGGSGGCVVP